tara:strand:+ start:130 stop:606 length:477 start_codon:yes stop_codon:yes gene_type:complete
LADKPFFVPQKEIQLFDAFNEELIDEIVGQTVDIYKVSLDESDTNVYGESVGAGGAKVFELGFQVNCLVRFNAPEVEETEFGNDVNATMEMLFHRNSLSGSNFFPEVGDIADWNDFYWELDGVTEPQLIAGHQHYRHDIKVTAHRVRLSAVNLRERLK